jgi:hypothetical protein
MHIHRILLGTAVALAMSVPVSTLAQDANGPATFTDRFPAEPLPTQSSPEAARTQTTPQAAKTQTAPEITSGTKRQVAEEPVRVARVAPRPHPRARVVVVPRSYLDAGTEVAPGERRFMDYAYPTLYQPYNVVTNIGGRVGWHNSPLPGPFFPSTN